MRILSLTIQNIASIADARIDFDKGILASEPIFLICGDTGAGKSTILNAICLALYDMVPYLDGLPNASDKNLGNEDMLARRDTRQLMRMGTAAAKAALDFIGNDGRPYSAVWSVRRSRNLATGNLQRQERLLKCPNLTLTKNGEIDKRIQDADVVGLTFQQFCRTTMLAQGQFNKFMNSDYKEKAEILEKLTGTEIYSRIGEQINTMSRNADSQCQAVEDQIKGKDAMLLSEERIAELKAEVVRTESDIERLSAEDKTLFAQITWLTSWRNEQKALFQAEKALTEAVTQGYAACEQQMRQTAASKDALAQLHSQNADLAQRIETEKHNERIYEKIGTLETLAETIEKKTASATEQKAIIEKLQIRLENSVTPIAQAERACAQAKAEYDCKKSALDKLTVNCNRYNLANITDNLTRANATLEAIAKIEADREILKSWENDMRSLREELNRETANQQNIMAALAHAQAHRSQAESLKLQSEAALRALMNLANTLNEARRTFSGTHQCPLCGSNVRGLLPDETVNATVEEARANADTQKRALEAIDRDIALHKAQYAQSQKTVAITEKRLTDCEENAMRKRAEIQKAIAATGGSDIAALKAQTLNSRAQLQTLAAEAQAAIKQQNEARKVLDGLTQKVNEAKATYDKYTNGRNKIQSAIDTAARLLRAADEERADAERRLAQYVAITPGATIKQVIGQWKDAAANHKRMCDDLTAGLNKAKLLEADIKRLDKENDDLKQLLDKYSLPQTTAATVANTDNGCGKNIAYATPAVAARKISQAAGSAEAQRARFANLEAQKPTTCEGATTESLTVEREQVVASLKAANKSKTEAETLLAEDRKRRAAIEKQRNELTALREARNNWKTLNDYFGGGGGEKFKRIAQTYVLRSLLENANFYLFKLFDRRFSLSCAGDQLAINVTDVYDGKARGVASLSGGESFVVSLSLALALASLGGRGINTDTLFIDEGFGSLSSDALNTVMEVLRRLHNIGGRRVGIISHVAELRTQIRAHITVSRRGNESSRVVVVG